MTAPLRVGLIGAGNVALNDHLPSYLGHPETFRVVAIADPTADRLRSAGAMAGLGRRDLHEGAAELIARDDVEMVDVCTPQHLRRDLVLAACAAGRHVLTEKPIATRPRDAEEMIRAARAQGVRLGVVHNYRFWPEVVRTLDLVRAGEVGPVEVAILNWLGVVDAPGNSSYRPAWRHDLEQAGGGVLMDMLHVVYVAEALLGRRIERVSGYVSARAERSPVEDIALARFETASSAALVNVGWGVGPGGFAVAGPDGRIEVSYRDGGSGAFAPFERLVAHGRSGRREEVAMPPDDSIARVLLDFAVAVREGSEPAAPGELGLHILEATLAVYLSAVTGSLVQLPLGPGDPVYEHGVLGLRELGVPVRGPVRTRGIFGLGAAR